jgi:hypothetical protein
MAIIPNKSDGETLATSELFRFVGAGSGGSRTSANDVSDFQTGATITINPGEVTNGIIIIAQGSYQGSASGSNAVMKAWVGTDATFSNNTNIQSSQNSGSDVHTVAIAHYHSSEDWANDTVYVEFSLSCTGSSNATLTLNQFQVIAF